MKKFIITICVSLIFAFLSCNSHENQGLPILTGKVYLSSEGMDSDCKIIPLGTDYFQTILFINDSVFVQIVNTCCGDLEEDFVSEYVSSGIYKLDNNSLTLNFNPVTVLYHVTTNLKETSDSTFVESEYLELEKNNITIIKFERDNCMEIPFFKQSEGEFKGEYISPTLDTLENYLKELEKKGVWGKLFPRK